MILLDDNFATIVNAIEEGRAVYANIRKFSTYVLASNVPEVVPYLAFGLFGVPLALTVPQILAVDLGTDMSSGLALGAEKPDTDMMARPPRPRTERLMNLPLLLRAYVFLGLIEAGIAMGSFFLLLLTQGWTWGMPLDWSDLTLQTGDHRHLRRHRRCPGGKRVRLPLQAACRSLDWAGSPIHCSSGESQSSSSSWHSSCIAPGATRSSEPVPCLSGFSVRWRWVP